MLERYGVERGLRVLFSSYGGIIARHPLYFVVIPVLVAMGVGSGMLFLDTTDESNAEALYAPENSRASKDRDIINELFSEMDANGDMLPQQKTEVGLYGQVIITRQDEGNVLTQGVIEEAMLLDRAILSGIVDFEGRQYYFDDICMKWQNDCHGVGIFKLYEYNSTLVSFKGITYPVNRVTTPFGIIPIFIGSELAGVTLKDGTPEVAEAKAIQLTYNLRYFSAEEKTLGMLWEKEFLKTVADFKTPDLYLYRITSTALQEELDKSTSDVIGKFSVTFCILITFAIVTCAMTDWVRSKPWLASLGVLSAGLSIITSFGLLTYAGVPFVNVVGSTPFLVIGIGIDDMFLMVAAWRKTEVTKTTEKRMREAFAEAAMSITITSITDALAFGIGAITPFYSIRIFCLYTGVAVVFDYIFQITFFAGCMALMGYREEKNLHVVTCRRVLPKDEAPSVGYRVFCAGGSNPDKAKSKSTDTTQHAIMHFFRDTYGPFLTNTFVIPFVCILYIGYLGTSMWGMAHIVQGLSLSRLAPDGSYAAKYYDMAQKYFSAYGPPVAIVVTEEIDYSNRTVQQELQLTLAELESSRYFDECCSSVWQEDYLRYLNRLGITAPSSDMFYIGIPNMFLKEPAYQKYSADIVFDNSTGRIVSSRFYIIPKDTSTSTLQKEMMLKVRRIASTSVIPMTAYSSVFAYYEQYVAVLPNTLQNLGIAIGAMFLVSIVMLPNVVLCLLMCLSIASIIIGIVGFMSIWNVSLDLISMINLIVSIGFTVDFSAHTIYAYITAPFDSPRKSAIHALYTMGMPITQAALSSMLAILILITSDTYIFRCFFKVMLLVMGFGALHGLVFLPVFLMIFLRTKKHRHVEDRATSMKPDVAERGDSNLAYISEPEGPDAPYTISNRVY